VGEMSPGGPEAETHRMDEAVMELRHRILVVEDDESLRLSLQEMLSGFGHDVDTAPDAESALQQAITSVPDLIIMDLDLPGRSGLELVGDLQECGVEATLVVLTGTGSVPSAVEAMRRGVFQYLEKPAGTDLLKLVVEKGLERTALRQEVLDLRREVMKTGRLQELNGRAPRMLELYRLIDQVAPSTATVLITGESGTGKDLVARTIHRLSPRAARPFVAINCAAIPATLLESEILGHERGAFTGATLARAGCFEQANDGTLFLDEIGEMPADLQSKLHRVLEDGKVRRVGGNREVMVDVRVVAATNADVEQMLEQGKLRADLYYRLNVFSLHVPPLRERAEDIPLLAEHFLEKFRGESRVSIAGFSQAALDLLSGQDWPGNVRELRNAIHRAVILCPGGEIQPQHLPFGLRRRIADIPSGDGRTVSISVGASAADAEKALILATLRACDGDKPAAARLLDLSLSTLYARLRGYEQEEFGRSGSVGPTGSLGVIGPSRERFG
jgi:two-component system, NtrC family, response regulator HydG